MRFSNRYFLLLIVVLLLLAAGCAGEGESVEETAQPEGEIAAWLDGEPIMAEEVDGYIPKELMQMRTQMYEARRATLENLVAKKLAEKEAVARGITTQEYYDLEVASKVEKPTDEQALAFYEQNKARIPEFQKQSFEELSDPIKRNLMAMKANELQRELMDGLKAKADFRLVLEPPRVDVPVPAGEPETGAGEGAAVTIVEFSDYECTYCKRAHPELQKLMDEYGDRVRLVYRDYPLDFHAKARPAAVAARCAGDQGKYWDYSDHLMTQAGSLDRTNLVARGEAIGLDMTAFNTCLDSGKHDEAVETALKDGAALGVTGTPTMFINGRMIEGVKPYEFLKAMVDEELKRVEPLPAS